MTVSVVKTLCLQDVAEGLPLNEGMVLQIIALCQLYRLQECFWVSFPHKNSNRFLLLNSVFTVVFFCCCFILLFSAPVK